MRSSLMFVDAHKRTTLGYRDVNDNRMSSAAFENTQLRIVVGCNHQGQ